MRKISRLPIVTSTQPIHELESLVGATAEPGPLLVSGGTIAGRVKDGFTLPLGGNVFLYGFRTAGAIPVLGAYVGADPDDAKLTQAFLRLHAATGAILVDWRAQMVLLAVTPAGQVEVWRP